MLFADTATTATAITELLLFAVVAAIVTTAIDNLFKQFVPRTHYFFSAGKDKKIKMWDADKFQLITTIKAHHSEVWQLGFRV